MDISRLIDKVTSPDEETRQEAILELVKINDARVIPVLKKIALTDPSVQLRYYAKKGLHLLKKRTIEEQLAIPSRKDQEGDRGKPTEASVMEKVNSFLSSEDPETRLKASQVIVRLSDPAYLEIVKKALTRETDPYVTASLLSALGFYGSHEDAGVIVPLLSHTDFRVRANAIEALDAMGSIENYKHIVKLLGDNDNRVRATAAKVLKKYGKINTLQVLKEMIESTQVEMRDSAIHCLGSIKEDEAALLLSRALIDPVDSLRGKAYAALKKFEEGGNSLAAQMIKEVKIDAPPEGYEAYFNLFLKYSSSDDLVRNLEDEDFRVRLTAIKELAEEGDQEAMGHLIARLPREPDPYVLSNLILAIGALCSDEMAEHILPFLESHEPRVRASAIEALGMMNSEPVFLRLFPCLQDLNNRVRANTIMALARYPHFNPDPSLRDMLGSPDPLMKKSALYAISDIADRKFVPIVMELMKKEGSDDIRNAARSTLDILDENWKKIADEEAKKQDELRRSKETLRRTLDMELPGEVSRESFKTPQKKQRKEVRPASPENQTGFWLRFLIAVAAVGVAAALYLTREAGEGTQAGMARARELYEKGAGLAATSPAEAITNLEEAVRLAPSWYLARISLGNLYLSRGLAEKAVAEFSRAATIEPSNREVLFKLALALTETGNHSKAAETLQSLVKISPDDWNAWFNLGVTLHKLGQLKEAAAAFDEASKSPKDGGKALFNIAMIRLDSKDYSGACEAALEALNKNPGITEAYKVAGISSLRSGRPDEAVKLFSKLVEANPSSWESHYQMALAYMEIGDLTKAGDAFDQVLKLQPTNKNLWVEFGLFKENRQLYAEALECYKKALEIGGDDPKILFKAGFVSQQLGDSDAALSFYKSAVKEDRNMAEAYHNMGLIYHSKGSGTMSLQSFKKALELDPSNESYRKSLDMVSP